VQGIRRRFPACSGGTVVGATAFQCWWVRWNRPFIRLKSGFERSNRGRRLVVKIRIPHYNIRCLH
jgi:hypothetical protein